MGIKKIVYMVGIIGILSGILSFNVSASNEGKPANELGCIERTEFEAIIERVIEIKQENTEASEAQILNIIEDETALQRGVIDIWNVLTESEKRLVIRYPFDALKVNDAKNIATSQTERKFGYNGLGDKSDAFRHAIWNAEMAILIGSTKAELFATAHEDKDVSGNESDGYPKIAHKEMDLHNNAVGRNIGEANSNLTEEQLADVIYDFILGDDTPFIWLHE